MHHLELGCQSLQATGGMYDVEADGSREAQLPSASGTSVKRVLIGHSLGAACAAAEFIDNPQVRQITVDTAVPALFTL